MAETTPRRDKTSYDRLIKMALGHYSVDLAQWLVGERPVSVRPVESVLAIASDRFTDKLLHLQYRSRPDILLHVEFQAEGDPDMPQRMVECLALLIGTLERKPAKPVLPACVVVYLHRKGYREDPGLLEVQGSLGLSLHFRYRVVKLWEEDPAGILALGSPGLCLFVPLMAGNPIDLLLKSQDRIAKSPEAQVPAERKRELFTLLAGLSAKVIRDRNFLDRLFSEIRLMGENYFFDLIRQEGHALGLVEGQSLGKCEAKRDDIIRILQRRIGPVPSDLPGRLGKFNDIETLERLLDEAIICPSIEAFIAKLESR